MNHKNSISIDKGGRIKLSLLKKSTLINVVLCNSGGLWIGCPEKPVEGDVTIKFVGSYEDVETNQNPKNGFTVNWKDYGFSGGLEKWGNYFGKGLITAPCSTLEIHGKQKQSWTQLSADAAKGSTSIQVIEAPTGWKKGDAIFIASEQGNEPLRIKGISGNAIYLESGLKNAHNGRYTDGGTSLNAAVGLMTRNIKFTSDGDLSKCETAFDKENCFGGHTLYLQHSTVHIEGAEFSGMGQGGVMARYPLHWHLAGDATGDYIKNNSIHDNFQRCLTIHGTANTVVESNACYNTFGHAFYLEDGIETGNVLKTNLMVKNKATGGKGTVCSDDNNPAAFWITNPNNSFIGNHSVNEGVGNAYWLTFPTGVHCTKAGNLNPMPSSDSGPGACGGIFGPSKEYFAEAGSGVGKDHWWYNQEQQRTPITMFKDNTAINHFRGIFIDGKVLDSVDQPGCVRGVRGTCNTCPLGGTGPDGEENGFQYIPFKFDLQKMPPTARVYNQATNLMEGSTIAYSKEKGFWSVPGQINNKGANFIYNDQVGFCQTTKWDGCLKVHQGAQGGNNCSWENSLIIGKDNQMGWTIYDGGIYIKNSRIAWQKQSSGQKFLWSQPNKNYGGNGNLIILEETGPLGLFEGDQDTYKWVHGGFKNDNMEWISEPVDKLDNIVSYARYMVPLAGRYSWAGYIMSVDNAWVHGNQGKKVPAVLTTTRNKANSNVQGWGVGVYSFVGPQAVGEIHDSLPTIDCFGPGGYGDWCDASGDVTHCSAYNAWHAGHWQTTIAALANTGTDKLLLANTGTDKVLLV